MYVLVLVRNRMCRAKQLSSDAKFKPKTDNKMTTPIEQILRDTDGPITDDDRRAAAAKIAGLERVIAVQRVMIAELKAAARNRGDWK